MKRHFTTLFVASLLLVAFSSNIKSAEIPVASGGDIASAISGAASGDVIVLADAGTYTITGTITLDKIITIKAADGTTITPIITVTASTAFNTSSTECGITFDGLEFVGPEGSSYFIVTAANDVIDHIRFYNTEIHHFGRCVVRSSNDPTNLRELIVDNCFIHNFTSSTWRLFWIRHNNIDRIELKNSTFAKFTESVLYKDGNDTGADTIIVNNCTVSEKIGADNNGVFFVNAESFPSSFSFSNSIVTNIESDTSVFVMSPNVADTIRNSRYYSISATALPLNEWNQSTEYSEADPLYADAANNDYMIGNESFKTASTAGGVIGDPRWYDNQTGLKPIKYSSSATIIPTKNQVLFSEKVKSATVYSLTGSVVKSAKNVDHILIKDLKSGIYIVKIKDSKGTVTAVKVVK